MLWEHEAVGSNPTAPTNTASPPDAGPDSARRPGGAGNLGLPPGRARRAGRACRTFVAFRFNSPDHRLPADDDVSGRGHDPRPGVPRPVRRGRPRFLAPP